VKEKIEIDPSWEAELKAFPNFARKSILLNMF
jgi:hypothetical protein